MRVVFADAGYWIAIANPRDNLHARATTYSKALEQILIVTSELVLVEVLNGLSDHGPHIRSKSAQVVQAVLDDPNIEVISHTTELFRSAFGLYRDRADKTWSLTDCASFLIMQQRGIADALTHDRHFEQFGLRALLRT